ncbi:MAG: hypothetical protein LBI42_00785 [Chitinispirillales bacterium]|nr:hypothetical protein [Chitinispirillales bacterium]
MGLFVLTVKISGQSKKRKINLQEKIEVLSKTKTEYDAAVGFIMRKVKDEKNKTITNRDEKWTIEKLQNRFGKKIGNYIAGQASIPVRLLTEFCQEFDISLDSFMKQLYANLGCDYTTVKDKESSTEQTFIAFAKKALNETKNASDYLFYSEDGQGNLFRKFLFSKDNKKNTETYHFSFLPIIRVDSIKNMSYPSGELTFEINSGMCKAKLEIKGECPQGANKAPKYSGFVVITGQQSNPTCFCYLWEITGNPATSLVISFRVSATEELKHGDGKGIRIASCLSAKNSGGKPFSFRAFVSAQRIEDDEMKQLAYLLRLWTSKNMDEDSELKTIVYDESVKQLESYLEACISKKEKVSFHDPLGCIGKISLEDSPAIINVLKKILNGEKELIYFIDPTKFTENNESYRFALAWLVRHGLHARYDEIKNRSDTEANKMYNALKRLAKPNEKV